MTLHRVGLGLTVLLALLTGGSGVAKLSGVEGVLLNAARWGFTPSTFAALGAVQLVITVLFVVPRTALLGGLLQLAYFGGASGHSRSALLRRPLRALPGAARAVGGRAKPHRLNWLNANHFSR